MIRYIDTQNNDFEVATIPINQMTIKPQKRVAFTCTGTQITTTSPSQRMDHLIRTLTNKRELTLIKTQTPVAKRLTSESI